MSPCLGEALGWQVSQKWGERDQCRIGKRHLEEYKNVYQRKEEEEGYSPTVKDSDHITVASAKMLTPATATHDPCNSLVCIKTNSFYPSRASWCSPTFLAGCNRIEQRVSCFAKYATDVHYPTITLAGKGGNPKMCSTMPLTWFKGLLNGRGSKDGESNSSTDWSLHWTKENSEFN